MPIQHKNIPDAELHELKGAASAAADLVPVSDGSGSTQFKRLNVNGLEGSVDANIAGRHVVTDGSGGLVSIDPAYARFNSVSGVLTTVALSRFTATSSSFTPPYTGWFVYHAEQIDVPMKTLQNITLGAQVTDAVSALVFLDVQYEYAVDTDGYFSVVGLQ